MRALRDRLRGQEGFTIIEVLVGVLIITVGVFAVIASSEVSQRSAQGAQRNEQATSVAQSELERIRSLPYANIGLTTPLPTHSTNGTVSGDPMPNNPRNPNWYVTSANQFEIKSNYANQNSADSVADEALVAAPGGVAPGPTSFNNGAGSGKIYRYVSSRVENCTGCSSKRITVAVVMNDVGNRGPTRPIYVSTIVTDPDAS